MSQPDPVPLIHNPAVRPGVEPLRTPLRGDPSRGILWDQPVKAVPEPTATDLVQYGGCSRCETVAEVARRYKVPVDRVEALLRSPKVTTASYQPPIPEGAKKPAEPITVIVLDQPTRTRFRAEAQDHKEAK